MLTPRNEKSGRLADLKQPAAGPMNRQRGSREKIMNMQRGKETDEVKTEAGRLKVMQSAAQTEMTLDVLIFHPVWIPASCKSSDRLCNLFFCPSLFLSYSS